MHARRCQMFRLNLKRLWHSLFLYFNENRCDFVVLEVGMGGCDDATNVIEVPEVAAIVNIDYDHMGFSGDNTGRNCAEKSRDY